MSQRPLSLPSWLPAAVAAGFILWAVSIWWMVATLPAGAADTTAIEDGIAATAIEMTALTGRLDALTADVDALRDERDALLARIDDLEASRAQAAEEAADAAAEADGGPAAADAAVSQFFTDGEDRYNCKDFGSLADAQEALDVNRPGDPNRIDTNNNSKACEDFKFPAPR